MSLRIALIYQAGSSACGISRHTTLKGRRTVENTWAVRLSNRNAAGAGAGTRAGAEPSSECFQNINLRNGQAGGEARAVPDAAVRHGVGPDDGLRDRVEHERQRAGVGSSRRPRERVHRT